MALKPSGFGWTLLGWTFKFYIFGYNIILGGNPQSSLGYVFFEKSGTFGFGCFKVLLS